ncbi:VOC family protein [Streptococcus pacificus]|uniref:VOC family protein n=1 Tax=Streptococcus pacificus TaxID=2740577 RepID=A0ABS0ZGP2_9STRE|nr:VOC family protein [Streptococcus pacificus]MBJ8325157.1 VOC family protein [Streptococcus pacificus]
MEAIKRIHHISAIVGSAQENLDFYRNLLKLKLVKQTVNFDDPSVYHLYFSNQNYDLGTLITFFPWENAEPGKKGSGQVGRIAFRIPKGSLDFWKKRLTNNNVVVEEKPWFEYNALYFQDIHGLDLAMVESGEANDKPDIIGFHGAMLLSNDPIGSRDFLKDFMGLEDLTENEKAYRLQTVGMEKHDLVIENISHERGVWGPGTVHHIAWSLPDDDTELAWRDFLIQKDYHVTSVRDRKYFKSIYLRETGKVIFEFATDGPGMTVDEEFEFLGRELQLPHMYEKRREEITANLKPLEFKDEME